MLNLFCGDSNNLLSVDLVPLSTEIYLVNYSCSIVQLSGFLFRIYQLVYNYIMNIAFTFIGCICLVSYELVGCFPCLLDAVCCVSCVV